MKKDGKTEGIVEEIHQEEIKRKLLMNLKSMMRSILNIIMIPPLGDPKL